MIKKTLAISILIVTMLLSMGTSGCDNSSRQTSDEVQRQQQENILLEGTKAVGMPAIKNFRERRLLKMILEKRDQEGLVTFTYIENISPKVVPGHTASGGKLHFIGESIGYGLSCATQYTNPQKIADRGHQYGYAILPQADPNGLFSPSSTEGSWVLMLDPKTGQTEPQYFESRLVVLTFKLPFD